MTTWERDKAKPLHQKPMSNIISYKTGAVVVVQLVERSPPKPVQIQSSTILFTINCIISCIEKAKIKKTEAGNSQLKTT